MITCSELCLRFESRKTANDLFDETKIRRTTFFRFSSSLSLSKLPSTNLLRESVPYFSLTQIKLPEQKKLCAELFLPSWWRFHDSPSVPPARRRATLGVLSSLAAWRRPRVPSSATSPARPRSSTRTCFTIKCRISALTRRLWKHPLCSKSMIWAVSPC